MTAPKYTMRISRMTVDKLGVKMYDRVSAVIAELVANSYDADATHVMINAPMGVLLAEKHAGHVVDSGLVIEVADDGNGMTSQEVNEFYLVVGKERRADPKRGEKSNKYERKVMGRKGVGKLAPFGVCQVVEVITAGGGETYGTDENGRHIKGFARCHLSMERAQILSETDAGYYPKVGTLDGTIAPTRGTRIILKDFDHRRVPAISDFGRQIAQRFGLPGKDWLIELVDNGKPPQTPDRMTVGGFDASAKPDTRVAFSRKDKVSEESRNEADYTVSGPAGILVSKVRPGFDFEDGFYPVTGWVGYSEKPYKDDLMAGIRVYCRGKIAAQTAVFNRKAGFTGEYDVRSYLIGELHADWLDEKEDLIRTDRQDILWTHELGKEFQDWGQALVEEIGAITREPMRKSAWEQFKIVADAENIIGNTFPGKDNTELRERALSIAKTFARSARRDELQDTEQVRSIMEMSLLLAPHVTLDEKLRAAAEAKGGPFGAITEVLRSARVAELSSFGRIADERIHVIETLETLKDKPGTDEREFQILLEQAPWLINPTWSPIIANESFRTLRSEFVKYYKKATGNDIVLGDIRGATKRPDFVLSNQDGVLQIIEIKHPTYCFRDSDYIRLDTYVRVMKNFLSDPANSDFKKLFSAFHVTLVCDTITLKGPPLTAFEGLKAGNTVTHLGWSAFLMRTRQAHQSFLNEQKRQRDLPVGK